MSRPRSKFLPSRRLLPFIFISTLFILFKSLPNEISQKAIPDSILSNYLNFEESPNEYYPHPSLKEVENKITTKSAGEHGTFLETSAYDLPKLIKSKNRKLRFKRNSSAEEQQEEDLKEENFDENDMSNEENRGYEGLRIAVLEHAGFHEEVVGAVIKTLGDVGANFTLYRDHFRWGYDQILESGMNYTIKPTPYSDGSFSKAVDSNEIDIVIHISCDNGFWNWPRNNKAYESMKSNKNLEIICMLHELENLNENERKSWEIAAYQERLTYLTLSKHVKNYLKNEVLKWSHSLNQLSWGKVDVEEFVPIFPVDASILPDSEFVKVAEFFPKRVERIPSRLAILGNIQPWRRNYNPILGDLHKAIQADPASWGYLPLSSEVNSTYISANDDSKPPVTLHFIGSLAPTAKLEIPESMKDMVFIHSNLEYIDFYRLLGSMDLILPAFIGWTYLEKKLSSAIPAGVVSKVPILGSELLLNSYQFLRDPSIILHAPGLKEIEAIEMLRKNIDPYTNQPISKIGGVESITTTKTKDLKNIKPLLPKYDLGKKIHSRSFGKQLPLGMKKIKDNNNNNNNKILNKQILESNFSDSEENWKEYHNNLYKENKEMFIDLFERLSKKIQNRKNNILSKE
ncbi:uncharacterized protein I206_106327 [Kwoniella pini CBS 10737]|uniref:Uncharacterized protein n=1 Tax=Kwoniella pini CBS 10737 TaxID=1296096 RepID=A0A1B9HTZ8_9TREE|nr:uncharacterized protein I206_07129 [Kwoniella pini CBS 10737]OCF46742.1 hypothetical protein I206_07129 [Kwoniella pini CBS 10737]